MMTSILKFAALAFVMIFSVSAHAEETRTMTKGTKSYQSAKQQPTMEQPAATQQTDPSKIEPAAGADMDMQQEDASKSFKEEMRLPRKN
jgi:hypothetical protein